VRVWAATRVKVEARAEADCDGNGYAHGGGVLSCPVAATAAVRAVALIAALCKDLTRVSGQVPIDED